jgi:Glycosyltransferase family 87
MVNRPQFAVMASGLAALCMWLYVLCVLVPYQKHEAIRSHVPRGILSDLYPRWLGTREMLRHGRDPYSPEVTREIQTAYYGRPIDPSRPNDPKDEQAFAYPVYVVIFFAPTVDWPFPVVQRLFAAVLILLTAASVPWWLEALEYRSSNAAKIAWILLTLGSFPCIQGFKLQQPTLLVAAFLARSLFAVSRRRLGWAGMLLALATIKPQLAALPAAWLCLWVLGNWRERQALFWSFLASVGALVGFGEWLLPGWIHEFGSACVAYYHYTGGGRSVLDVLFTSEWGRVMAAITVTICLIFLWRVRHAAPGTREFCWSLALVMATTLVIIPMFAPYNQILVLPALMVLVRALEALWKRNRLTRFLTAVTTLAVLWPWLAAIALVTALLLLPSSVVEKAWSVPLYTSVGVPVAVLGTLIAARPVLCRQE